MYSNWKDCEMRGGTVTTNSRTLFPEGPCVYISLYSNDNWITTMLLLLIDESIEVPLVVVDDSVRLK